MCLKNKGIASLYQFYMGFLRHEQESLNNEGRGSLSHRLSREHYLMLPASDYPLVGCSPAEPTSVSSDTFL